MRSFCFSPNSFPLFTSSGCSLDFSCWIWCCGDLKKNWRNCRCSKILAQWICQCVWHNGWIFTVGASWSWGAVYWRFVAKYRLRSVRFTTSQVTWNTTSFKNISSENLRIGKVKNGEPARHNQAPHFRLPDLFAASTTTEYSNLQTHTHL